MGCVGSFECAVIKSIFMHHFINSHLLTGYVGEHICLTRDLISYQKFLSQPIQLPVLQQFIDIAFQYGIWTFDGSKII